MASPEFDISDFDGVIAEHDKNVKRLRSWRRDFAKHPDELADFLIDKYPIKGAVQHARLVSCFKIDKAYQGNRGSFTPWDGVWRGTWKGSDSSSPQYHLWDQTSERDGQFVQPVTQSTSDYVTRENFDEMTGKNKVDLGINVWSPTNGLTGWVSKRQNDDPHELPHIAYAPNARTLIWIAQRNFTGSFWMFYEWVNSAGTQYGIYGMSFTLGASGVIRGGVLGQATYNSVHRDLIRSPYGGAQPTNGTQHTVVAGESLSLITKKHWSDMMLFPLVYDANVSVVGSNWNLIHPGMVLTIPDKSSYTHAQLGAARKRARAG